MEFVLIAAVAFLASGLTLYSGFGLGTLLLPAFALFLPPPAAVAATAVVHLLNNVFKAALVGRQAHWGTVVRFGLPAVPAAILGGWLLGRLGTAPAFSWAFAGREFSPTAAGVVVGLLMILFAVLELQPWFQRLSAPSRLLPVGGLASGFFGGLTGQQGALRSMFLLKTGLDPARFIATGVVLAVLVDLARLPVYAAALSRGALVLTGREAGLLAVGTGAAFLGAWLGARYIRKTSLQGLRLIVAVLMIGIGAALAVGVIGA